MSRSDEGENGPGTDDRETLLRKERELGLPAQQIFSIFFNQLYQGIQITLAYNIGVFVVRHFCHDETEERIGELTGILASAFSTAQLTTSYFWGVMTDKIGRKPVVLIANFVMGIATVFLGLAPNYWLAVAARCLGGVSNGSGVAIKTMLAESCDANTQAKGMAYLNLGWGLGNICGPMIGGFLSQPCDQYANFPLCNNGTGLFARQPFLLPCLVVGALSFFACFNSACMMVETHPKYRKGPMVASAAHSKLPVQDEQPATSLSVVPENTSIAIPCGEIQHERGRDSSDSMEGSALLASVGRTLSGSSAETRQLLRRLSARVSTRLLSGYRSLSMGSDDVERHEYVLEMTPGHDVERDGHGEGSTGGWGDRQGLVHGPAAAQGAPNDAHTPASQRCPSRLSQDSSLTASAAATPTHLRHSEDGAADAHVTVFRPSLDASREHSPLTNGSGEQVGDHAAHEATPTKLDDHSLERTPLMQHAGTMPPAETSTAVAGPQVVIEDDSSSQPWYKSRKMLLVLGAYASIAFLMNFLEELTPIFASAPYDKGGLNFKPDEVALPVSFAGLGLILFSLLAYQRIQKRLGCLACAKIGLTVAIPMVLLIPMPSLLVPRYWAVQSLFIPVFGLKAMCSIMCMTSSMILVNLTAPIEQIGPVNGAGNTLAAGMRALGPALSGQLWALSLATGMKHNQFFAFGVVACAFIGTRFLYGFMHPGSK
ncbi:g8954 [Coccomyxa elongata]